MGASRGGARRQGAPRCLLPSGSEAEGAERARHLLSIQQAARTAAELGIECHAGHGLAFDSVGPIAAIPELVELNIGHFLISEAIFTGLEAAIRRMRDLMDQAREQATVAAT